MGRYFAEIAYDGTAYHGWQIQENATTVQEVFTKCLKDITRQPELTVVGCGRTDTGVHAKQFFLHFEADHPLEEDLSSRLNNYLPKDIACYRIFVVEEESHARFDATSRTYHYLINQRKDPFQEGRSWYVHRTLDIDAMQLAADALLGTHDFTSFSRLHTQTKTNNCTVTEASVQRTGGNIVFEITANRFLRNMVRAVVGTLVNVGLGQVSASEMEGIIQAKDRAAAGESAPACGLYLVDIQYPFLS